MIILVPEVTERLKYTFDFVFQSLGLHYMLTTNENELRESSDIIKWTYGKKIDNLHGFAAHTLLFEKNIYVQRHEKVVREDIIGIFAVDSELGMDIFASIFYLLSRYEEYLPSVKDVHGRYAAFQSIAVQYKFLEKAMVNRYLEWIRKWIQTNFAELNVLKSRTKVLFSFDIDHPFYAHDLRWDKLLKRKLIAWKQGDELDRYETYDFIFSHLENISSIFFFLCPEKASDLDNYLIRDSDSYLNLISELKNKTKIGIHPSYYAAEDMNLLNNEIHWLSVAHGSPIKSSRYHYLRNDVERNYPKLIEKEILNDFSMAYGDHAGFRSSTSLPYHYFDLHKNRSTRLMIYTPCIMDSTFAYNYQSDFTEMYHKLWTEVKEFGGVFLPIFHNDILAQEVWRDHFIHSVNIIRNDI